MGVGWWHYDIWRCSTATSQQWWLVGRIICRPRHDWVLPFRPPLHQDGLWLMKIEMVLWERPTLGLLLGGYRTDTLLVWLLQLSITNISNFNTKTGPFLWNLEGFEYFCLIPTKTKQLYDWDFHLSQIYYFRMRYGHIFKARCFCVKNYGV